MKTSPLTKKEIKQRNKLDERLKGRKLPKDWLDDAGVPNLQEDQSADSSRPETEA